MITASSAPIRVKHNRLEVCFEAGQARYEAFFFDENAKRVRQVDLVVSSTKWNGLAYNADGDLEFFTEDTPAGGLAADFVAFSQTSGGFRARADALEARLQSTGRFPT